MQTINIYKHGIEWEIDLEYTAERTAPLFAGTDSTLMDAGAPSRIEIFRIVANGYPLVGVEETEFINSFREDVEDAIN